MALEHKPLSTGHLQNIDLPRVTCAFEPPNIVCSFLGLGFVYTLSFNQHPHYRLKKPIHMIPALTRKGTPGLKGGIDSRITAKALALFGKGVSWGDSPLR